VEKITRYNAGKDIQCNLNSVCAALFARNCLKSRAYYKVCKIDFGVDECAKPLPDFKEHRKTVSVRERWSSNHTNRFDALFNDDETEGDETESDDDSSTASATTYTLDYEGETESWADSTAADSATDGGTELY
jgi:hypothetical protein